MSFQWIFDRAETISINKQAVVAQSITRTNRVKSAKIGGQTWRFDVKLPDGTILYNQTDEDLEKLTDSYKITYQNR